MLINPIEERLLSYRQTFKGEVVDDHKVKTGEFYFKDRTKIEGTLKDSRIFEGAIYYSNGEVYNGSVD